MRTAMFSVDSGFILCYDKRMNFADCQVIYMKAYLCPDAPIGVMDSGVGGLTVARRLRERMPGEDILYIGDSANCPYGNRSREEILSLAADSVRRLEARGAKCIVVACNTISATVEELRPMTGLPVISIVESAAEAVVHVGLRSVAVAATEYTAKSGIYERCLRSLGSDCRVTARSSPTLAALIDSGRFDGDEAEREIRRLTVGLDAEALILGCTHYPLAESCFRRCCELPLIDPAAAQAERVLSYLRGSSLLADRERGRLSILCSAAPESYTLACRRLGLSADGGITVP